MNIDKKQHFALSPLQTPYAIKLLKQYQAPTDLSTIVLIDEEGAHVKNTAVFRILRFVGLPLSFLGRIGLGVPTFLSDPIYDTVAYNRATLSKYWPFKHRIEDYSDRMVGLEGKTVWEASGSGDSP